jgi:DNA-binding CsgD family transcriptional regulator
VSVAAIAASEWRVESLLPGLASPQNRVNGSGRPAPGVGHDLRRLLAVLDTALEAIAAPALVLSARGEIVHANAFARARLASGRAAICRLLAAALSGGATGAACDLAPLGSGTQPVGFLAILRGPARDPSIEEALRAARRRWKLTPRQVEVLGLVARGLTNDLIADTLGVGRGTVEFHVSAIFDKAGVSNRTTLVARALEIGRR